MEARRYEPRYTVADYEQWPGDWELWHGTAVSMAPSPTFDHQEILTALASSLREQLKTNATCHCRIVVEHDWRIANDTVVRPDLMIVCDPFAGEFLDRAPTLVAEVLSPATEDKDRHAKRELYVAQGVKHYLIVRPGDHAVEWI
ncbi:MAG: Uma2 family endonuclease, partial [Planctomycetota bacterium]